MTTTVSPTPAVGDVFTLTIDPISRTTLALFAGASGDSNPMHIDLDVARSAGLEDVFAHGMLSMAFLGRLLTDITDIDHLRQFRVRFSAITPLHAQPTCRAEVSSVEADGSVTLSLSVVLADDTVTLQGDAVLSSTLPTA